MQTFSMFMTSGASKANQGPAQISSNKTANNNAPEYGNGQRAFNS